jgi:cell division protein FtsB
LHAPGLPSLLISLLLWLQLKRVEELKMDISRLELSITSAKAEYEKIKAANLSETTRFAAERRAEYSLMLENFTAIQVS